MKALSIYAPYVNDICDGSKTEEYRSWKTNYRGDLLICAAARKSGYIWLTKDQLPPGYDDGEYYVNWSGLCVTGHAMCIVNLVDCRLLDDDSYAWILSDLRLIKPIPIKGKQNLFNVDIEPEYIEFKSYEDARRYYAKLGLIDAETAQERENQQIPQ